MSIPTLSSKRARIDNSPKLESEIDTKLPYEIELRIFEYFDRANLREISQVSKRWEALSKDDSLWKRIVVQTFKFNHKPDRIPSWKGFYIMIKKSLPIIQLNTRPFKEDVHGYILDQIEQMKFYLCSKDEISEIRDLINQEIEGKELLNALLDRLINFCLKRGLIIQANKIYSLMEEEGADVEENFTDIKFIRFHLESDNLSEATELVQEINNPYIKDNALIEFVRFYLRKDDFMKAQNELNKIQNAEQLDEAQLEFIHFYLKKENLIKAKEALEKIQRKDRKDQGQLIFINYYLERKQPEEAEVVFQEIENEIPRHMVKLRLVKFHLHNNQLEVAQKLIQEIDHPLSLAFAQIELAKFYLGRDQLQEAEELIYKMDGTRMKDIAYMELVKYFIETNEFEKAEKIMINSKAIFKMAPFKSWK